MYLDFVEAIMSMASKERTIHTSLLGIVKEFDSSQCTAKVKPYGSMKLSDGQEVEYPVISGVPVFFPSFNGVSLSFPVSAGDKCLLIIAEDGMEKWRGTGMGNAKYSLNNAVALVGFSNAPNKNDVAEAESDKCLVIRGNVKVYGKVVEK